MRKIMHITTQVAFLILFALLVVKGKVQLWMGIFLGSVIISIFLGRFYCGWICPINTIMKAVAKFKKKIRISSFIIPNFLKSNYSRYSFLAVFLATFIFVMTTGKKLPVLPSLLILGAVISVLFTENLWHKHLCPYGTILNLASLKAFHSLKVDLGICNSCGVCMKVCPGGAITRQQTYTIDKGLCLLCYECSYHCPKQAIKYQ